MKYTTPDNLPYPEGDDDFAPLEQWLKDLADATQAALGEDSGWITPKLVNGFRSVNSFGYRVRRGFVSWRGAVAWNDSSTQFPSGYTTISNDLPTIARPSAYFRAPVSLYNGIVANLVISGGRMDIGVTGTSANAVYFGAIGYPNA